MSVLGDHIPPIHESLEGIFVASLGSTEMTTTHPVARAALAHFEFLWILPFEYGNGRMARLRYSSNNYSRRHPVSRDTLEPNNARD
ncbi:hypothetical protein DFJ77DRAFT_468469 [Powellomyces hirtus]|nr:hypothetical protein DFJ77DRAFT_468469 [Powellomyces hirtus]